MVGGWRLCRMFMTRGPLPSHAPPVFRREAVRTGRPTCGPDQSQGAAAVFCGSVPLVRTSEVVCVLCLSPLLSLPHKCAAHHMALLCNEYPLTASVRYCESTPPPPSRSDSRAVCEHNTRTQWLYFHIDGYVFLEQAWTPSATCRPWKTYGCCGWTTTRFQRLRTWAIW